MFWKVGEEVERGNEVGAKYGGNEVVVSISKASKVNETAKEVDTPSPLLTFTSISDMSAVMPEVCTSSILDMECENSGGMTEVCSEDGKL